MVKPYMAWTERTSEEVDIRIHAEIIKSAEEDGFQVNRVNKAWIRDMGNRQEISSEFRPGFRSIWLWES